MDKMEELERAAQLASAMPWESGPSDVPYAHKKQFQDACSPEVILRLVAIARAAKHVAFSNGFDAALPDKIAALRAALGEQA